MQMAFRQRDAEEALAAAEKAEAALEAALVEEARRVSRKALQRCAVVLTASGLVAADGGTTTSVGCLTAGPLLCVMCSRWSPSAVPLADSSVFWCCCRRFWSTRRPLTSPTDLHGAHGLMRSQGDGR